MFTLRRELTVPPAADTWSVFGRKLRLDRPTFALRVEPETGSSAWQLGVGSVVLFNGVAVFAGRKPGPTALLVIAACVAALWCWLCVRLLAPALALRLRRLEGERGAALQSCGAGLLEQARQGYALCRALRRLVPLDSRVLPLRRLLVSTCARATDSTMPSVDGGACLIGNLTSISEALAIAEGEDFR